tara:strand:+ start:16823 stop:18541 length:1719 start_codon:yes stop_codon:yes gene_type:complete
MKSVFRNLNVILNKKQKNYLIILVLFSIILGLIETISIGSLVGFIIFISEPEIVSQKIPLPFIKDFILSLEITKLAFLSSVILIFVFLFKNLFLLFFYFFQERVVKNIYINLAKNVFGSYLLLPYSFHVNQNPSVTINSVNGETKRVTDFIVNASLIFKESITVCFLFLFMFAANFKIAGLLFLMMFLTTTIFYKSIANKIKDVGIKVRINSEKILQKLTEAISSIKIIKLTDKNDFFVQNVFKEMAKKQNNEIIFRLVGKLPRLILEILAVIIIISILLFFLFQDFDIKDSIPILSLVTLIILRTLPAFTNINTNLNNLRFNIKSVENISNLKNKFEIESQEIVNNHKNKIQIQKIEVKGLTFGYGQKDIFKDINLDFIKGNIYGFKGESGVGKTTLIDLILGLLIPSKGNIFVNGSDILEEKILGKNYASYVPQEIYLNDNSIAENIAFGLKQNEINFEKIEDILKKVELSNYINSLPKGYNTIVGDKGVKLSGGQRQRIGLARALYDEGTLLVLDEATSALDLETEGKIIDEIKKLKDNKIIFLVAHKSQALEICDKIITIKDGKVSFS